MQVHVEQHSKAESGGTIRGAPRAISTTFDPNESVGHLVVLISCTRTKSEELRNGSTEATQYPTLVNTLSRREIPGGVHNASDDELFSVYQIDIPAPGEQMDYQVVFRRESRVTRIVVNTTKMFVTYGKDRAVYHFPLASKFVPLGPSA